MGASLKGIRISEIRTYAGDILGWFCGEVAEEARIKGTPVGVHVKVDTGMGGDGNPSKRMARISQGSC